MIDDILVKLLFSNHFVIIPKIGAFIANYNSANIDVAKRYITPPSFKLSFNSQINNNDGVLINALTEKENITYTDAELIITNWAAEIKQSLQENKNYIFKNIGRLYIDSNNNILFESYNTNFSKQHYGLPKVATQPITRLKDAVPIIIENHQIKLNKQHKKRSYILLVMFLLTLVGVGVLSTQSNHTTNIIRASIVNFFSQKQKVTKSQIPIPAASTQNQIITTNISDTNYTIIDTLPKSNIATVENSVNQTLNKTDLTNESESTEEKSNAYICVGAFQYKSSTKLLLKEVEFYGLKAIVIKPNGSSLYRVLVTSNTAHLEEDMDKVRGNINAGAWLYCNNCSF